LDGSRPTASSTLYTAPITLSTSGAVTINAIAVAGGASSPVATAAYTVNPAGASPVISPADGSSLTVGQAVTLTDTTAGASIYYTLDGSTPTICGHRIQSSAPSFGGINRNAWERKEESQQTPPNWIAVGARHFSTTLEDLFFECFVGLSCAKRDGNTHTRERNLAFKDSTLSGQVLFYTTACTGRLHDCEFPFRLISTSEGM
jgi:hypothetical protein